MNTELNLSNTSYTNKDFRALYQELLALAKELSYKWDPTVSNESDPLVVVLKEMALIADKLNYSADKLALESFPLSATQEETARAQYKLLGYFPKWYVSCVQKIVMQWNVGTTDNDGETLDKTDYITIPKYTAIQDKDGNYTYTILDDVTVTLNGTVSTVNAIEGYRNILTINNEVTNIQLENLDSNNRLYIADYAVAQNGIFVKYTNDASTAAVSEKTDEEWKRVDNVYAEQLGTLCFSLELDIESNQCYLQFPDDIATLIGSGLSISYIISTGVDGSAPIGELSYFQTSSLSLQTAKYGQNVTVDSESLYMQNSDVLTNPSNPETIDQQYKNYKKTCGTFDTLVTLRDYTNAIYETPITSENSKNSASNGYACDRTNDIQESYKIVQNSVEDLQSIKTMVEQKTINNENVDAMTPYNIKLYALKFVGEDVSTLAQYQTSFVPFVSRNVEDIDLQSDLYLLSRMLDEQKCVQHNFQNIEENKMFMINNVFDITCKIVTTTTVSNLQFEAIRTAIETELFRTFNSREEEFGEKVDFDKLYSTILNADDRIKNVIMEDTEYFTYAVYYEGGEQSEEKTQLKIDSGWKALCISDDVNVNDPIDYLKKTFATVTQNTISNYIEEDGTISGDRAKAFQSDGIYYPYIIDMKEKDGTSDNGCFGYVYKYDSANTKYVLYSTRRNTFRTEVVAKNILAGVTPYYKWDSNGFKYQISDECDLVENVTSVLPSATSNFKFSASDSMTQATSELHNNESVVFYRPSLIEKTTYGAYVKYYYSGQTVPANTDYILGTSDLLAVYYKANETDQLYTCVKFGAGKIICPNFALTATDCSYPGVAPRELPEALGYTNISNSITIKEINSKTYNEEATNYCYVITEKIIQDDDIRKYVMEFNSSNDHEYILGQDEYFIYTDAKKTYMVTYGSGTKITTEQDRTFMNEVLDANTIAKKGTSALEGAWQEFDKSLNLTVTEQEYYTVVGDGASVTLNSLVPVPADLCVDGTHAYMVDPEKGEPVEEKFCSMEMRQQIDGADETSIPETNNTYTQLSGSTAPEFVSGKYYKYENGDYLKLWKKPSNWETNFTEYYEATINWYNYRKDNIVKNFLENPEYFNIDQDANSQNDIEFTIKDIETVSLAQNSQAVDVRVGYGLTSTFTSPVWRRKIDQDASYTKLTTYVDFEPGKYYEKVTVEGTSEASYLKLYTEPADWQTTYSKYYQFNAVYKYTKITSQPYDWYTNLDDYFKDSEGKTVCDKNRFNVDQNVKYAISDSSTEVSPVQGGIYKISKTDGVWETIWKRLSGTDLSKLLIGMADTSPYYLIEDLSGGYLNVQYTKQAKDDAEDTETVTVPVAAFEKLWSLPTYQGKTKTIRDQYLKYYESKIGTTPIRIDDTHYTIEVRDGSFQDSQLIEGCKIFYTRGDETKESTIKSAELIEETTGGATTYKIYITLNKKFEKVSKVKNGDQIYFGLIGYNCTAVSTQSQALAWNTTNYPTVKLYSLYINDPTDVQLNTFSVSISNPSDSDPTDINVSQNTEIAWQMRTYLSMDLSCDKSVKLEEGQKVTVKYKEQDETEEQEKEISYSDACDTFVNMSESFSFSNDKNTSTALYDDNGEVIYPTLLVTKVNKDSTSSDTERDDSSKLIELKLSVGTEGTKDFEFGTTTKQIKFGRKGKYVLCLKNYSDMLSSIKFYNGTTEIYPIGYSSTETYNSKGVYYYVIEWDNGAQGTTFKLSVTVSQKLEDATKLELIPSIMVDTGTDAYSEDESIRNKILELDRDRTFDYLYEVDEGVVIEKPTQADQFFNSNHFYNKFTIAKINDRFIRNVKQ